jgi:hypothetical protein
LGDLGEVMTNIVVQGWRDQKNPKLISLVDAMRRHAGLSLPAAKKLLDDFAEHGQVVVRLPTPERAAAFVQEAESIGAVVHLVPADA